MDSEAVIAETRRRAITSAMLTLRYRCNAQFWELWEVQRTCRERRERVDLTKMTHSCLSTANFAVVHNGPHDVVAYGRRPTGGLGETASHYKH
jgi:hypothetical protein